MMDPIRTIVQNTPETGGGFQIDTTTLIETTWHPGIFLVLLGIFWILVGLTGKGTTSKCIHYGEVIKKIRV